MRGSAEPVAGPRAGSRSLTRGLAQGLRDVGRHEEALAHYRVLLELNPGDNQGVRYLLLAALLERGVNDEAGVLLVEHEDDLQALWPYGRLLRRFPVDSGHVANARGVRRRGPRESTRGVLPAQSRFDPLRSAAALRVAEPRRGGVRRGNARRCIRGDR